MHLPPFIPLDGPIFGLVTRQSLFPSLGFCLACLLCYVRLWFFFFFLFFPGIYYADLDPLAEPIFSSSLLLFSPFMSATVLIIFANLSRVGVYSRTGPCQGGSVRRRKLPHSGEAGVCPCAPRLSRTLWLSGRVCYQKVPKMIFSQ